VAVGIAAFGCYHWHSFWSLALLLLAAAMFCLALVWPRAWAPVQAALDRFARGVAAVLTWILLGAVFVGCFIPGRLLLALLRRDPLHRAWEPARSTYWETLPRSDSADRFRRQF
jgi:hypothetical protein